MFKDNGVVRYDKTLQIPSSERIPALTRTEDGYKQVYTALVIALQQCFSNLNLRKGFNEDQLLDLSDMIIEQASEDNLSLEDVLLFLQQLVSGKAGRIYDRLDIPTFFELFEGYRQERYMSLQYLQYEAHAHYKGLGDTTRSSDGKAENDENTKRVMMDYYKKNLHESEPVQSPPTP